LCGTSRGPNKYVPTGASIISSPTHTSVSAIAERAGVQRQTYYRYFPDERSVFRACTGLYMERNPLPDPRVWRTIADPNERLRKGLTELYDYYAANEPMLTNVTRDASVHAGTREMVTAFVAPAMADLRDALAEGLQRESGTPHLIAALDLVLDFNTWRLLVRGSGLSQEDAVELVAAMLRCIS
jgi:AcrR family transcriptional regulator